MVTVSFIGLHTTQTAQTDLPLVNLRHGTNFTFLETKYEWSDKVSVVASGAAGKWNLNMISTSLCLNMCTPATQHQPQRSHQRHVSTKHRFAHHLFSNWNVISHQLVPTLLSRIHQDEAVNGRSSPTFAVVLSIRRLFVIIATTLWLMI